MTSSMSGGEKRWGSSSATRRGGMIVLGKVVAPKPMNLPSQRLENHGMDPSVEIVPKGTYSWGSKSSSSTSNAWGSSTLSPRTDGGPGSPSYLSGRPSSGGSGTRPSTASSDRVHEPAASAWGPNSRPSSASGALTSNQTSLTSLRPRSAETRPGSSQLSRFAESLPESPGAWGAAGTAEKLGVTGAKNDGFSLTSGDFPTLGSEKDNSGKNNESQDHDSHGHPGEVGPAKEGNGTSIVGDVSINAEVKSGTTNSWRRDTPPYVEDGVASNLERWQGNPQPYPNPNIPPQHYEAWHGPPVTNPPSGVWFRGPPGGPPYGGPVGPGGFPMEPYSYYRTHIPPALANPQPGPRPGGQRGHHPKNGDMYRPHMPDAYMRPGMPIRPGFYPGPVAYDGYYGGPMGYCSSNERDVPFMGLAPNTSVYNRYSSQNVPEPGGSQGRSGGYGPTGKTLVSEHVESGHPHDARGPYRVLLKQHNSWEGKNEEKKWEDTTTTHPTYGHTGDQTERSSWDNDWSSDYGNDGETGLRRMEPGQEISCLTSENQQSYSSGPVKVIKRLDDISAQNPEQASSGLPEGPGPVSAVPKDSTLIEKIEGLNAKVRASDGHDVLEEQKNKTHVHNAQANHLATEGGSGFVHSKRTHAAEIMNPASRGMGVSAGDKNLESAAAGGTSISRRPAHGVQGRSSYHGKGGLNNEGADGRHKKIPVVDSPSVVPTSRVQTNSNVHVLDCHTSVEASEKSGSYSQAKEERESSPPTCDLNDYQAQRLEQRAKQLREEEEERTRRQMAKAHAKLEELNRRKTSMEGSMHKSENASGGAVHNKQESIVLPQIEGHTIRDEQTPVLSSELPPEKPKSANKERIVHNQSLSLQQDADSAHLAHHNNSHNVLDGNASKHKRLGYKQKQNILSERSEKATSMSTNDTPNNHADAVRKVNKVMVSSGGVANDISLSSNSSQSVNSNTVAESSRLHVNVNAGAESSSLPANSNAVAESTSWALNSNAVAESSVYQKKKNRSGKNKHKVELASSMTAVPASELKETCVVNASSESSKPKTSETKLDPNLVQSVTISDNPNQLSEHHVSLTLEDSHGRTNNSQWKSQHSRRTSRNPQVNRAAEKSHSDVIWAPVRSQNKAGTDEACLKIADEVSASSIKSDHQAQSNSKNKRAEMERYVPKPVAKEMTQQGSIQQPVASSINQSTLDEPVATADSISQGMERTEPAKVGLALEPRNEDGKQNKQGKGSWLQRGLIESVGGQSVQDGRTSYNGRNVKKSNGDYQPQRSDVTSLKEQPKYPDEWNVSDRQKVPDSSDSVASVAVAVVKDQGVTGRVKRHPYKGQRGVGNNTDLDYKRMNSEEGSKINSQSAALEMSQTELPASKENRGTGERSMAHWQPKHQSFSANNQQGSRGNNGRNVGAGVWTNKKESTPQIVVQQAPPPDKRTSGVSQPLHDQSPPKRSDLGALNVGNQEATRGRKVGSLRERAPSPSRVPVGPVEHAPESMEVRQEQRSSSGFRRNGNQNSNRVDTGHESRGNWNLSGQESKRNNPPSNWERQRHHSHFEYQPVGAYHNNKTNNAEGHKDGNHNTGPRGQNHSRRGGGHFNGRQRGNDRVDAGFD